MLNHNYKPFAIPLPDHMYDLKDILIGSQGF